MRRLVSELQRRNVFRIAIAYVAVSWLLLQAGALIFDAFELPRLALRMMFALLLLGFVPALIFSWVYEITPEGLKRENEVDGSQSITRLTSRKLNFIIIGVLAGVVAILLANQYWRPHTVTEESATKVASAAQPVAPANAASAVPTNSIAVLPFTDMSQAKDQEYFSDGMSEELLNLLAQVPGLHVAGRTSSFSFKGKNAGIAEIGKALNVATVLEGSLRKSGNRLRITAQLINVADGYHLWSQTYERKLTDVFAMQDEIAGAVVDALKLQLLPAQRPDATKRFIPSPGAYDQFLLGRQFANRNTQEGYASAFAAYRRAVALEPHYADAYAALSLAEKSASFLTVSAADFVRGQLRALAAAEQAIASNPALADGYAARGAVRIESWDWAGAQADIEKAFALNPESISTYACNACFLATQGRLPEAIVAVGKTLELNPLSAEDWNKLGRFNAAVGDLAGARQALNRGLAISPKDGTLPFFLGVVSLLEGHPGAARAESLRMSNGPPRLVLLAVAEHDLGHKDASQQGLEALLAKYAQDYPYRIAQVHAWRGERDQAIAWLERAYAQHDRLLRFLKFDPLLRYVHGDARYSALLRKMELPE